MRAILRSLGKDWALLRLPELLPRDKTSLISAKYIALAAGALRLPGPKRFRLGARSYFYDLPMDPAFFVSVLLENRAALRMVGLLGTPGLRLVDVGAHNGETALAWTILLKEPTIYSFEPHPGCYRNAQRNLQGLPVDLRNVGLGDEPGDLPFDLSDGGAGTSTFAFGSRVPAESRPLPMVRGDDVILGDVDVIKVDVEGFEHHVLNGMRRLLANCRALLLELSLVRDKDSSFADMARLLADTGLELVATSKPHQATPNSPQRAIDLYMARATYREGLT